MPRVRLFVACLLLILCVLLSVRPASGDPAKNWMLIWSADDAHAPETLWFRQRFRLPKAPVSARLRITADDSFKAYLNERKAPVATGSDWTTVQEFDVTRYLKAGPNLLAVEAQNTGGPGGLIYKLVVRLPGGKPQLFFSDGRVRANRRAPPAWATFAVDDSHWPLAKELAPANGGVWGPLHGALTPDASRLVRLWDIRAGGKPGEDPYTRPRHVGDRMILSASASSPSDMKILSEAGFTLFQTDSDHLSTEETAPGHWDWSGPDAARKAVQSLGLDWCYFPHEAFPPPWYAKSVPFVRIQCLEHQQPVRAFSPWDPSWPGFIDSGYEALSKEFAVKKGEERKLSAIYVGVHGDYGEAGLLMGARISVPGQREDWLRRFGNLHDHLGWWCSDPLARADFKKAMLAKYGSLDRLNAAWKRDFKSPDEITYPEKSRMDARQEWLDFVTWYDAAVGHAIEANLGAQVHAAVRSTHGGFKPFADNAATMLGRLGSASRFYGAPFWTEPPGGLSADQEVGRIFEAVSQGATGYFDWAGNAVATRDVYYRYGKYLRVEKPVVDVAMFYPAMAQKLKPEQGFEPLFAQACAYLRDAANFDIVDDRMVQDGCLENYRILVLWQGMMADQTTLDRIKEWVNDGGVLIAYDFGKIQNFDGDASWFNDMFGYVQELAPAKVTERYVGDLPDQYQINVGDPAAADYLGGEWFDPDSVDDVKRRWTSAEATVRLPVDPDKQYTLIIRASVPKEAAELKRRVLVNGHEVGDLESPGDVTYRFPVPEEALADHPLSTLTFASETFQPVKLIPDSQDKRHLGVWVQSVQMVAQDMNEEPDAQPPPGTIRREMDLRRLTTDWTRRYGRGLTIYFPANRQLLKGYIEVVRRAIYHLSEIDPGRKDALPVDNAMDGVYATLFTDKVLYYNPKDVPVTKTVTIPPEAFAAWADQVVTPEENTWKLTLEPHSIGAITFTPPPQELLFECEKFLQLGGHRPLSASDCSPGKGATCVRLSRGEAISTQIRIETPGRYTVFTRCVQGSKPEPVEILIDGRAVAPINARAGQTLLCGTAQLTRGTHTLTLRSHSEKALRADFVLLCNDSTIAGYDFAIRTAPVD